MSKPIGIAARSKELIEKEFKLTKKDVGDLAVLKKKGMRFETEAYSAEGLGHVCFLSLKAPLGLMRMETVVICPENRDIPLINLDAMRAFGSDTQIVELYNTELQPPEEGAMAPYAEAKEKDSDIPDYKSGEHWYDSLRYPESYAKVGKGFAERLSDTACEMLNIWLGQAKGAQLIDSPEKKAKIKDFAETLYEKGGPAVDTFVKLFGRETARRMVVGAMYGVDN